MTNIQFLIIFEILIHVRIYAVKYLDPPDLLDLVEESCIVGFKPGTKNQDEVVNILETLDTIYKDDAVSLGFIDLINFMWPNGAKLEWDSESARVPTERRLIVFEKRQKDRTCLSHSRKVKLYTPKAIAYTGSLTVDLLVQFINEHCRTFRQSNGHLSAMGLHKEYILDNLFKVADNSITLKTLNESPKDPLKRDTASKHCIIKEDGSKKCDENYNENKYLKDATKPVIPECERIDASQLSKETFFNSYLKLSKPVILTNAMDEWAALEKWTNEYLVEKFGKNNVHIKLSPHGEYEGVEPVELWEDYEKFKIPDEVFYQLKFPDLVVVRPASTKLRFDKFMDLVTNISSSDNTEVSAYLEYSSIPNNMPELEEDIAEFPFVKGVLERKHLNAWISDGNTLGKLHFDPFDNFLCQISGRKQLILFEPHNNRQMYEAHIPEATLGFNNITQKFRRKTLMDSTSMVMAPFDILKPDFKRFTETRDIRPLNCTINEGEVLFMPSFWWHEVQSFPSETIPRNLAVNFWYKPFLVKEFPCQECKLDVNPEYYHLLEDIPT